VSLETPSAPSHNDQSAELVQLECARLLWAQAVRSIALVPPVVALLFVVMSPYVASSRLWIWVALMALTVVVGLASALGFRRADVGPEQAARWIRLRIITSLLHGACWGSSALLIMPGADHRDLRLVIVLFLVAVLASQAIAYAGSVVAFTAVAVPGLIPTIVVLMSTGDQFHTGVGVGGLVYLAVMSVYNRELHHSIVGNIRLRFEHAALADHLAGLHEAGEQANRELRIMNTHVEELAHRDELTGALNRRALMADLRRHADRIDRDGGSLCLALIDLDHFKMINDEYGHLAGDAVLRSLSDALSLELRSSDSFARYGGEEFVMTLIDTEHGEAREIIERIRRTAERTTTAYDGATLRCTVSIGAAPYQSGASIEAMFAEADAALYRAKASGRNRIAYARDTEAVTV
jgi:diguanylate cyclase (GGDEF)-like protein